MKALITLVALTLTVGLAMAETIVVNFDDLEGFGALEPGYGGIASWGGPPGEAPVWGHNVEEPNYPALSPPMMAISIGGAAPIEFGQEVTLVGLSYAEGQAAPPIPTHLKLLLAGLVVFEIPEFYPSDGPVFWECPYDGMIDTMILDTIVGQPYGFFCIDDLTYDNGVIATESTSWGSVKSLFK